MVLRPSSLVLQWCHKSIPKVRLYAVLAQSSQLRSQLFSRSEERILGGFFGSIQHLSDGAQAETLVVLQFKNHALARRQLAQRRLNPFAQDLSIQLAFRIRERPDVGYRSQQIDLVARMIDEYCLVFFARLAPPQLIQTKVGDNAVNPRVERALEAEVSDIPEGLQKRFLIDILCVVLGAGEMQRQAQHLRFILTHQRVESHTRALLRLAN